MRRYIGVLALAVCLTGCGASQYDGSDVQPVEIVPMAEMTAPPVVSPVQAEPTEPETAAMTAPATAEDPAQETAEMTAPATAEDPAPETLPVDALSTETMPASAQTSSSLLSSPEDIGLHDTDGNEHDYVFTYDGIEFTAIRTWHHWRILDSYRITDMADMQMICEALCSVQQIPDADGTGWRTPEDMAYEWAQHDLAYSLLPEGSDWRRQAKDVDFDPEDQGRSLYEIYRDRTGT